MATTKTKGRKQFPRKLPVSPLTPEQWALVMGVERLCWQRARMWTPESLRNDDNAIAETYTVMQDNAIYSARSYDPNHGAQFTTYFMKWAFSQVRHYWASRYIQPLSLNQEFQNTKDTRFIDVVADIKAADPTDVYDRHPICDMVKKLPERQREAIERTYGINGYEPQTSPSVARTMGITENRVRNLVANGRKMLWFWSKRFEEFL